MFEVFEHECHVDCEFSFSECGMMYQYSEFITRKIMINIKFIFFFQMHVLYVLSFIVERVGFAIRPHSGSLIQYLPLLWEESAEHNMLRCAIVSTLVHLVKVYVLSL
jgi:hypothetical protein